MNLTEQINSDIKTAMKARDKETLTTLRDIKSKLLLEATKEGGNGEIEESVGMKILNKLFKQRMEAAELYKQQGRDDLYAQEMTEAEVLKKYLPQPMTEDEIKAAVSAIIQQMGASTMADMGKVMGMASKQMAGKADGKVISTFVKQLLG